MMSRSDQFLIRPQKPMSRESFISKFWLVLSMVHGGFVFTSIKFWNFIVQTIKFSECDEGKDGMSE